MRVYWFGILTGESSSSLPRLCGLVSKWRIVSPRVFFLGGGMVTWEKEGKWLTLFHFMFLHCGVEFEFIKLPQKIINSVDY